MTISEDELTNALIENFTDTSDRPHDEEVNAYPEAHYNHYGERGYADVYIAQEGYGHLYEIKSLSAVNSSTGANAIIRQFNKMRKHFFKGSDHTLPEWVDFELVFTPERENIKHILDNSDMYMSMTKETVINSRDVDESTFVSVRLPDVENITPIQFFRNGEDFREIMVKKHDSSFEDYVKTTLPELLPTIEGLV